jgi:hypothetical protein
MIWMVIMKACAGCITWTAVLLLFLSLLGITNLFYDAGLTRQVELDKMPAVDPTTGDKKPYNYYLYGSYAMAFVCFAFFCTICSMYRKIQIAIKIMETAADFVTEVCTVMLVPPVISVLTIAWFIAWLYVAIYVYAQGTFEQSTDGLFYGTVVWTET